MCKYQNKSQGPSLWKVNPDAMISSTIRNSFSRVLRGDVDNAAVGMSDVLAIELLGLL
jgi:hypothetical protein